MGGLLGGGKQTNAQTQPAAASLRFQTSAYGLALPLVYGKTRVAGNLIWYGDFTATPHNSSQSAGKGGGGGGAGAGAGGYAYSASIIMGLCEGPVGAMGQIWRDKNVIDSGAVQTVDVLTTVTENFTVPDGLQITVSQAAAFRQDLGVTRGGVPLLVDGGATESGGGG